MSEKAWVTEPDEVRAIRLGAEGVSARKPITVCEIFKQNVAKHGDRPALCYKADGPEAPWSTLTWNDYYGECVKFAKTLLSLGFAPHRCTNIIGFNRCVGSYNPHPLMSLEFHLFKLRVYELKMFVIPHLFLTAWSGL